jgi:hypothetical protein
VTEADRATLAAGHARGLACTLGEPRRTPAGRVGERLGHRAGSSIEFMDFREYAPGDDIRRIDWSAYARSDRLMIRLHREEVTPHLDLLVDASDSMALPDTAKRDATLGVAAVIAGACDASRWSSRVWTLDTGSPGLAAGGVSGIEVEGGTGEAAGWVWPGFGDAGRDRVGALRLRPRGVRVVVSDLLFESDPDVVASRWADGGAGLWVVQVLAAQDADPRAALGFEGDLKLIDAETGHLREVRLDPAALRLYRDALTTHRARWSSALSGIGGHLVTVIAEEMMDDWSLRPLFEAGLLGTPAA